MSIYLNIFLLTEFSSNKRKVSVTWFWNRFTSEISKCVLQCGCTLDTQNFKHTWSNSTHLLYIRYNAHCYNLINFIFYYTPHMLDSKYSFGSMSLTSSICLELSNKKRIKLQQKMKNAVAIYHPDTVVELVPHVEKIYQFTATELCYNMYLYLLWKCLCLD